MEIDVSRAACLLSVDVGTAGMMASREDRDETCGCAENKTADWLRVRVKCYYYVVEIDSVQASRF